LLYLFDWLDAQLIIELSITSFWYSSDSVIQ
jgi:hypothetical protein